MVTADLRFVAEQVSTHPPVSAWCVVQDCILGHQLPPCLAS
eukprot:SAG22_NODE_103_length_20175_cov_15.280833_24_plen_41_part_00